MLNQTLLLYSAPLRLWRFTLCLIILLSCSCSIISRRVIFDPFSLPADYISQKEIVLQGFCVVPTPEGEKACIYFGYDRDKRLILLDNLNNVSVDLIEFKLLKPDRSWKWEPLLVFVDDNFDGYANRMFLDKDFDGAFDTIYEITDKKVVMDENFFLEILPWESLTHPTY